MELQQFLDGYKVGNRSPSVRLLHESHSEAHNLAEAMEARSAMFGELIDGSVALAASVAHIEGRDDKLAATTQADHTRFDDYQEQLHSYFKWYVQELPVGTKKVPGWRQSDDPFLNKYADTISRHTQIHDLNAAFEAYWYEFICWGSLGQTPSQQVQRDTVESLTLKAAELIQYREKTLLKNGNSKLDYLKGTSTVLKAGDIEGFLNEIETAIALLHLSLKDPDGGWWVLPAPAQFEYLAGQINSDLLVIDTKNFRGTGVQVKSGGKLEPSANGGNDRVVQISGRHDLGNIMNVRHEDDLGHDTFSYAGALALAVFAGVARKDRANLLNSSYRLAYLMSARSKPKTLEHAVDRVGYKLRAKL